MSSQNSTPIRYCFTQVTVDPEDITCVHAAFKSLDAEKLLGVLLQGQLSWKLDPRLLTGSAKRHLLSKTSSALQLMYSLEPDPSPALSRIIVPVQTFEYLSPGNGLRRDIRSVILDVSKVTAHPSDAIDYALSIPEFLQAVNAAEHPVADFEAQALTPVGSLIGTPWPQVLGHALWAPAQLTEYERYSLCASIFWVMAFNGLAEVMFNAGLSTRAQPEGLGGSPGGLDLFFEEQELKMARLSELLNRNSLIDLMNVSDSLQRCA